MIMDESSTIPIDICVDNDRIFVNCNPVVVHHARRLQFRVVTPGWIFPDPDKPPYTPSVVIMPNENKVYPFSPVQRKSDTEVHVQDTWQGSPQQFRYRIYLKSTKYDHHHPHHVIIHDPGIKNEA
jgi:hypothetical protein